MPQTMIEMSRILNSGLILIKYSLDIHHCDQNISTRKLRKCREKIQYGGQPCTDLLEKVRTVSSSFSIPVGICGTDLLMVAKSGRSGMSSALKTGIGREASSALARKVTLLILK